MVSPIAALVTDQRIAVYHHGAASGMAVKLQETCPRRTSVFASSLCAEKRVVAVFSPTTSSLPSRGGSLLLTQRQRSTGVSTGWSRCAL